MAIFGDHFAFVLAMLRCRPFAIASLTLFAWLQSGLAGPILPTEKPCARILSLEEATSFSSDLSFQSLIREQAQLASNLYGPFQLTPPGPVDFKTVIVDRPDPKVYADTENRSNERLRDEAALSQIGQVLSVNSYIQQGIVADSKQARQVFFENHDAITSRSLHVTTLPAAPTQSIYKRELFEVLPERHQPLRDFRFRTILGNTVITPLKGPDAVLRPLPNETEFNRNFVREFFPNVKQAYQISRHFMQGDALANLGHTLKVFETILNDSHEDSADIPVFCSSDVPGIQRLWKSWGFEKLFIASGRNGHKYEVLWASIGELREKFNQKAGEFFVHSANTAYPRASSSYDNSEQTVLSTKSELELNDHKGLRIAALSRANGVNYRAIWNDDFLGQVEKPVSANVEHQMDQQGNESLRFHYKTQTPEGTTMEFLQTRPLIQQVRVIKRISYVREDGRLKVQGTRVDVQISSRIKKWPVGFHTDKATDADGTFTVTETGTLDVNGLVFSESLERFHSRGLLTADMLPATEWRNLGQLNWKPLSLQPNDSYYSITVLHSDGLLSNLSIANKHFSPPTTSVLQGPHDPLLTVRVVRYLLQTLKPAEMFFETAN